jgi:hypothetical protein
MTRSLMLTMAAVLSAFACTDNPNSVLSGPIDPTQPILPSPSMTTIAGRISVTGFGADRLVELHDGFDNVYRLVGAETKALATIDGADVIARGTFDGNPGFVVEQFQVTGMYGRPALDGVLEATDDGFALRLVDGSLRAVIGLTGECAEYVGARLWVIGWEEGEEVQFGRIGAV